MVGRERKRRRMGEEENGKESRETGSVQERHEKERKTAHLLRFPLQHRLVRNLLQPSRKLSVVTVQFLIRLATGDGDLGGVGDDDVVAAVVCGRKRGREKEEGKSQKRFKRRPCRRSRRSTDASAVTQRSLSTVSLLPVPLLHFEDNLPSKSSKPPHLDRDSEKKG
jgi:hypothetical protein